MQVHKFALTLFHRGDTRRFEAPVVSIISFFLKEALILIREG